MIAKVIEILHSDDFHGAGKYTEIAKGRNQYVSTWRGFKRKLKREWRK